MNSFLTATLAIVSGIITLAIISVVLSRNAQTPQVLGAAGSALGTVIGAATAPVMGGGGGNMGGGSAGFGSLGGNLGNFGGGILTSFFGG